MKKYGRPRTVVTDGLRACSAAMKEIGNADRQEVGRRLNNRAENSHQPFRRRERAMQHFRSVKTLQKFSAVHAQVHKLANALRGPPTENEPIASLSIPIDEARRLCAEGHCHGDRGLRGSRWPGSPTRMNKISGYRFPPEIVQQAIWLYLRFTLSLRDDEDLLAERGVAVSYETVRRWVNHFGPRIAADLRKRRLKPHTTCWSGRPPTASM